jgi:hypothetical protein
MAKIKFTPDPTFKLSVSIPVPGVDTDPTEFTFKYRNRTDVLEWLEEMKDRPDVDAVYEALAGWSFTEEFCPANVSEFCDSYPGAAPAILGAYLDELRGARAKN